MKWIPRRHSHGPQRLKFTLALVLLTTVALPSGFAANQELVLKNDFVQRVLTFDGQVWRTTQFARVDGSGSLSVVSDEFHVLLFDDRELTLDQYRAAGEPVRRNSGGNQEVTIRYIPRAAMSNAPSAVTIRYWLGREPYLRKEVRLEMKAGESIDRLEVERFSAREPASRGGRGEPVFIGDDWFFGVEYPAFYSRHTDGNTPPAWSGPYDRLGNYSFIDLENRDVERHPRPGLVRLMHFPGDAKRLSDGSWGIAGKTAVAGLRIGQPTMELAFLDYLDTIRRPVRSFLHYNNWYDRAGKRLTAANFVTNTFLRFKENLAPYGVRLDAMVPDDGWNNPKSVYQPNPVQFPRGMDDLAALGDALRATGTQLGLWIALNGYNSNIDWGRTNGFAESERNTYFKKFKRYYSLTDSNYNGAIRRELTALIARGRVEYFKHDFNDLCDTGAGRGHPATDRHGHEASVDAELELLALERAENPNIYQNVSNWIWFSPWWLAQANSVWMLAGDTGEYRGYPELSRLIMASAYRDVHLYHAWHDPATRPLVPISHLMTHGIIFSDSKYSDGDDSLRDFGDYVMMYYMRGVQLKEWYITPGLLTKAQWEVLGRATRWSQENTKTLANTVLVGGDPGRGEAYGYVAWNGNRGILTVRNPAPGAVPIAVPFDASVWYRGAAGKEFHARVVYPYQAEWPATFRSGESIHLEAPGDSVLVFELESGRARAREASTVAPVFASDRRGDGWQIRGTLPDETMQRCDLLVINLGDQPEAQVNGQSLRATRTNHGPDWRVTTFDLREFRGHGVDLNLHSTGDVTAAWLVMDRPVRDQAAVADPRWPAPLAQGFRRQTSLILGGDRAH